MPNISDYSAQRALEPERHIMAAGAKQPRRRLLRWGLIIAAAGVLGAGWYAYRWSIRPSIAKPVAQEVVPAVAGAASEALSPKAYNAAYFSADIPTVFELKRQEKAVTPPVLQRLFFADSTRRFGTLSDQLAITVGMVTDEGLSGVGDVHFRLRETALYTRLQSDWAPPGALVFERTDNGYELGVFWRSGSSYAAVVMSGSIDRKVALREALQMVLHSWLWR